MKIICSKTSLLKSASTVSRAVSQKTTMPILQCILLKAQDGEFSLTGNDLELGIFCKSEAAVKEEGSVAVNAKIFGEIIRRLPEEDVIITSDDNDNITIESGKSKFNIPGQKGREFPLLPEVKSDNQMVLPQNEFRQMVQKTIFSIAQEDTGRPILTGELVDVRDGYMYIVAVDGFRISMQRTDISGEKSFKMTVPGKALNELVKILSTEDNDLMTVTFTGRHILFKMDETMLISRLLEGEFLNYERNMNMSFSTRAYVNTKALLDSIDRAALISKEGKNSPVRFDIRQDKIVITSNTEAGSAYEEVPIRLEGEGMVTAFNPRYYMDALRAIDDETVCILYASSLSPCIIQGTHTEDYKYFILPIRLN